VLGEWHEYRYCIHEYSSCLQTVDEFYKVASIGLENVSGQILMGLMVKPPRPGTVSYPQYAAESQSILDSLRLKAHIMTDGFNDSDNVICNFTEGLLTL
jgi:glutamate--glyoxylate aminotransferase